jgi:hypothetical protein
MAAVKPKRSTDTTEIVKSFLTETPPGEFEQCLGALEGFLARKVPDKIRNAACADWSHRTCRLVPIEGRNVLVIEEARLGEGIYVNPYTNMLYEYDFGTGTHKCLDEIGPGANSPDRVNLQWLMDEYMMQTYKPEMGVGVFESRQGVFTIVMRCSSVSLQNYRTGNIAAKYILDDVGHLTGEISVMQHFYEKGNVMCTHRAKLDGKVGVRDVAAAVEKIKAFESAWMNAYLGGFDWLAAEGVIRLRRKLPISGTKINWEMEFKGADLSSA